MKLSPSQVLALGFAGLILLGALLLTMPMASKDGQSLSFLNALFTATSAVCVTGLVVVDTGSHFTPFGQFVIIFLIQVGGLGFMTFSTLAAILIGKKIGLKERMVIQESFNQDTLAGLVKLTRNVLWVTLIIEGAGGLILTLRFLADFPLGRALAFGFFHAVSSFCNAGFDLFGQVFGSYSSITHYVDDWIVTLTVGGLIILGGIGFPVIMELVRFPRKKRLSLHSKLVIVMTVVLIGVGALLIFLIEFANPKTIGGLSVSGKFLGALFQSITPRTAGYNSLDISKLRTGTWFIMIILMFIGASPSSTGGGIKTTTFGVLVATIITSIKGRQDAELFERHIPTDIIYKAITILTIALSWVSVATLVMSLVEPYAFIRLFFEVMSAFGTVGLTTGITPDLTVISKIIIIITMFIGRVGPVTILIALSRTEKHNSVKFVEERLMIG
ncbi:MAG TPA: TrkH family potassium uptake protein [Bacillota bacterium]